MNAPEDAEARRAVPPVICYPTETLPQPDLALYTAALGSALVTHRVTAPPRDNTGAFRPMRAALR